LTGVFKKVKLKLEETKIWPKRKLKRRKNAVVNEIRNEEALKNQEVSS